MTARLTPVNSDPCQFGRQTLGSPDATNPQSRRAGAAGYTATA